MACAAVLAILANPATALADPNESTFEQSDRFTNRDLLEQSERDQRLWLSGLVLGLSSGLALKDEAAGECVAAWFFEDRAQAHADIRSNMERFPDHSPAVIVAALAIRACPGSSF